MTTLALHWTEQAPWRRQTWLHETVLSALGVALIAALAQLRLTLPFTPVPLTGQTLGVLLVGAALGPRRGARTLALYLLGGGLGLPLFAGGAAGWAYLAGPTLGYLLGFIPAAALTGWLAAHGLERSARTSWLPFALGTLVIYACGAGWLALSLGWRQALLLGVLPFLPGDALKAALAAGLLPLAWRWTEAYGGGSRHSK